MHNGKWLTVLGQRMLQSGTVQALKGSRATHRAPVQGSGFYAKVGGVEFEELPRPCGCKRVAFAEGMGFRTFIWRSDNGW